MEIGLQQKGKEKRKKKVTWAGKRGGINESGEGGERGREREKAGKKEPSGQAETFT